jgi:hypothetical protein
MISPRIVSFFIFSIEKLFPEPIRQITGIFQQYFQFLVDIVKGDDYPLIDYVLRK